ncbi:Gfo/Idh/MocA family oxidoreductase [Desulfopila sp. IMCC35006]|uniref:Gfo/Idh/MocA family protein n=1 Tax=Desulfopila sp. IMCC35006 TaxID=2569542 RepID=UPI0010AC1307|nr:Gfo/Idh/MocA family oxidoreductase [Desulfopila sp. IMCC35006]TKB23222.1 Gfo/Idh/MocA family oxidoreductase [Desulfopila sp. IMCC35006]
MLNIGIVGCGYWGPNLIRNFNALKECRVKTICDIDKDRLARMKSLYPGSETVTDFDVIVNDPEIHAVAIATPVHMHFELAKKSLEAGKHILIEKPMASSVEECVQLKKLAEKNKLTLMVGHTFLYSQTVRKIKEIIKAGDLGRILYISARRLNLGLFQKDINVAWDLAPHDISIILNIMESEPVSVNCQGKANVHEGIEDITNMTINFQDKGFATIKSSWLDPNKIREMTFVGSKRMLVYNDIEPNEKVKIYDKRVETPPHYDTFGEFQHSYHYGDMYSPYIKQDEPLKIECQHFLDCIKTGDTPISGAEESLRVVQILEASSTSLKNGGNKTEIKKIP